MDDPIESCMIPAHFVLVLLLWKQTLLLNDIDSSFDVGESMHCGQNGLPLILLTQFSSWPSIPSERGGIHKSSEVEVFLKMGHSVFHLIVIKIGFHKGNLYVGLERRGNGKMFYM